MPNDHQNPYLTLTPSGVMHAFAYAIPNDKHKALQTLVSQTHVMSTKEWLNKYSHEWLDEFDEKGWIQHLSQNLPAPNMPLDKFLPYVVASLSGTRKAVIGSNEGFCLARIGYTTDEADRLAVAGADFFDFFVRQHERGLAIAGQAVSLFGDVELLMPTTSFMFLWIDNTGYVLILDGEPLTNNRALVELVWAIKTSGLRFSKGDETSK